ncbi:glycoside hydrolase [Pedobacter psychrophilus]|uniref:Glycoside hydrolase n=1 Tax=Pedobacter psychrophilus TaxID=1826909 RepID=A0A179DFA7_9SPHI|nr:NlpC/P60 family protein [Pedobacter psychrophilus]OAQ39153.1 glycoside hydrolase [Pedobacter psychrophilus]
MKKILIFTLLVCFISTTKAQNSKSTPSSNAPKAEVSDPDNLASQFFSQVMGVAISATSNTKMYQFIYDWLGTPYHLGGDTKKGIDCSGFAFQLYDKTFNTIIGSNSRNIFSMVNPINKSDLKEGDLVFFKIHSKSISHVGVYIGDNKFAHASSSKGVMISNLEEAYWQRYFYKGGRILESLKGQLNNN